MPLNVWSYLEEYESERDDILRAVDRVFRSGQLILGENVAAFEREFASYCGVSHGVGVDNGTDAVMLALLAAGVEAGDDVVTVSNTAAPTVVAANAIGARVRFVDIDPATLLMNVEQLEASITPRTTCLLPVHLFGQCVNMDAVCKIARKHHLLVVEDCAQAHGAHFHGRVAGSFADAAAFSFYPTKVLGAYGDAGMVITRDDVTAGRLRRLRYYGMEDGRYYVVGPGYNTRLDEVQAAILRYKLQRIESYISRRRNIAAAYAALLERSGLVLPLEEPGNRHVYYIYVVRHPRRDDVVDALARRGVLVNVSYRWPIHLMPGFAHLGYRSGELPETERAAGEIFSLPMYPALTDAQLATVSQTLWEVLAELPAA